jgi:hypothetical protein
MTKHRKTKRRQRGGGLFDWFSSSTSSSEPGMYEKTKNMFSGFFSSSNAQTSVPTNYESTSNQVTSNNNLNAMEPSGSQYSMGGRRSRRRHRKMRGGKGGLGLTYYATPVSGIKVVEPTYWINGGSRKRRHTRRHK